MPVEIVFDIISPAAALKIYQENDLEHAAFSTREQELIARYSADMSGLRWQVNGDGIIFDTDGRLLDGRLRIVAAVQHAVSFPTMIVQGIDRAVMGLIDTHKRRSHKDAFHAAGHDDSGSLAAIVNTITGISTRGLPSQTSPSHGNALRLVKDFPDVLTLHQEALKSPLRKLLTHSDLAALTYLTRLIDPKASKEFFDSLAEAVDRKAAGNSPIQALARGLLAIKNEIDKGGHSGSSKTRYVQVTYFIKTWNAVRNGTRLLRLKVDNARENPPLLDGLDQEMFKPYVDNRIETFEGNLSEEYYDRLDKEFPEAAVETITPEIAEILLEKNGPLHGDQARNRSRTPKDVEAYGRDMIGGHWGLTGQAIKISKSGRLLDGQHRLVACIQTNTPFETVVVRGLAEDIFSTFDVGQQQTVAHVLAARGEANTVSVAGALRKLWMYREVGFVPAAITPTTTELLDLFEQYPDLPEHVRAAHSAKFRSQKLTGALLIALMAVFTRMDEDKAASYFHGLETGASLKADNPILELREALSSLLKRDGRVTIKSSIRLHLMLHAWLAHSKDRKFSPPKSPKLLNALPCPPPFDRGAAPTIDVAEDNDWIMTPAA